MARSGLWVTQAYVRRARGGGDVHVLRLGMKSAALRGAIAESRLQDHHRPYHDTGSNASAAPKRSSSSVIMECSIKTDARTPPWQQRRCRHGGRSYLGIIQRLKVVVSDCFAFRVGPSKHCAPFSCSALCPNSQLSQSPGTYTCDIYIYICMHFRSFQLTYFILLVFCIAYNTNNR